MITAMIWLYNLEFTVDVSTNESLEAAINEYNFTTDVDVTILESKSIGKYLYVLYKQDAHKGYGGLALLERGIFGKYRFHNCNNFNWQLYNVRAKEIKNRNYLLIYCLNDLPNVATYNLYNNLEKTGEIVYTGNAEKGPFLNIIETSKLHQISSWMIRYFDENGKEINEEELTKLFEVSDTGDGASVGSAEKGLIYVYLIIVLLLGIAVCKTIL